MLKQIISNGDVVINLNRAQALKLELEINHFIDKEYWIKIGDKLYNFHAKDINDTIIVDNNQMVDLVKLCDKLNIKVN